MFGFLNIFKPVGPTSHHIVAQVRRRVGKTVKVGHAGTLDPFADGVLVICLGFATRLAQYVQNQPKTYRTVVHLGAVSTTDDVEGEIAPTQNATALDESRVREALGTFVGEIQQIPPSHSAVHINGRRAYHYARSGEKVELKSRSVFVESIELIRYEYPRLELEIHCGSGTYIRSIARDIGAELGVGGYCEKLTRTAIGEFTSANAVTPDELDVQRDWISPITALADLPRVTVPHEKLDRLGHGRQIRLGDSQPEILQADRIALLDTDGELIGLAKFVEDDLLQPIRVFLKR